MDRETFERLLLRAVDKAIDETGRTDLDEKPQRYRVYAPNAPHELVTLKEAMDIIYISTNKFFKIIDVSIIPDESGGDVIFLRVSGHEPVSFANTWDALDLGPFKQIGFVGGPQDH